MKLSLLILLGIFYHLTDANCQSINFLHNAGSTANDEALDVCQAQNGNVYTTGYFSQTVLFDNITYAASGNGDAFVSCQTSNGTYEWAIKIGGFGSDRGSVVTTDPQGNIIAAGTFSGLATVGSLDISSNAGSQDVYVIKISPDGTVQWVKSFGGPNLENVTGIACSPLGEIWLTGQFRGTAMFGSDSLSSLDLSGGSGPSYDIYLLKLNSQGGNLFVKAGQSTYNDRSTGLDVDLLGNAYVCGHFSDTLAFVNEFPNTSLNAGFIGKFDPTGNPLWFKRLHSYFLDINALDVRDNQLVVAGDFKGQLTLQGPPAFGISGMLNYNIFCIKMDLNGAVQSHFKEGSENPLSLADIALSADGELFTTGTFSCTHTDYSLATGPGLFNSVGYSDIFIAGFNAQLQRISMRQFGGQEEDEIHGISMLSGTSPVIAGSFIRRFQVPATFNFYFDIINDINEIIYHPNSGLNYCNDPTYGGFIGIEGAGNKDILVTCPYDSSRSSYDFYVRSGNTCAFPVVQPHISPDVDSLTACDQASLSIWFGTGTSGAVGPDWKVNWTDGNTDFGRTVSTSGWYHAVIAQKDGCRTFSDSIFVTINQSPELSQITSPYGQIFPAIPVMNCLEKLTKFEGDTALLVGLPNDMADLGTWSGPGVNVLENEINAVNPGVYLYTVTNQFGCYVDKCVQIFNYIIFTDGTIGTVGGQQINPAIYVNGSSADTVEICYGQPLLVQLADSATASPAIIPAFGYWDLHGTASFIPFPDGGQYTFLHHENSVSVVNSGNVHFTTSILNPPHNLDTNLIIDRTIYVIVNPLPVATASMYSNSNGLCPGDTATVFIQSPRPFALSGNYISLSPDSSFFTAVQPGNFVLSATIRDSLTGCESSASAAYTLEYKIAPVVGLLPASGIKCPPDSVLLTAEPSSSVAWIGPQGNVIGSSLQINVNPPGDYYYIQTDDNGCVLLSNTVEVKDFSTPEVNSDPGSICNGQPAVIAISSDEGVVFNWLPPLSGSDTIQVVYEPGLYIVQASFCNATVDIAVNVEVSALDADIDFVYDSILCTERNVLLAGNEGMDGYLWAPGNVLEQNYYVTGPGWIYLTIKDEDGCTSSDSLFLEEFTSPPPPDSVSTEPVCPGSFAYCVAYSDLPIYWYSDPEAFSIAQGDTIFQQVNSGGQVIYAAAYDSSNGCPSARIPVDLLLIPEVILPEIPDTLIVCHGETANVSAAGGTGVLSGTWTGPGGFEVNSLELVIPSLQNSGNYIFIAQPEPGFCPGDPANLYIKVIELNALEITTQDTVCEMSELNASVNAQAGVSYTWVGPDGSFITLEGSQILLENILLSYDGNFTVTSMQQGCSRNDSFTLTVIPKPPQYPVLETNSPVCLGDTIFLHAADSLSDPGIQTIWVNTNGFIQFGDTLFLPDAQFDNSVPYGLVYQNWNCLSSLSTVNVTINPLPEIQLDSSYSFCEGDVFTLDGPPLMSDYLWSNGEISQSIEVTEDDTLVLMVQSLGCWSADTTIINALYCDVDRTPNTFSPNNDGINDQLKFRVEGGVIHSVYIFDRWGKKIIDISGPEPEWNGKDSGGHNLLSGTYFFTLTVGMINGQLKKKQGTITLFE